MFFGAVITPKEPFIFKDGPTHPSQILYITRCLLIDFDQSSNSTYKLSLHYPDQNQTQTLAHLNTQQAKQLNIGLVLNTDQELTLKMEGNNAKIQILGYYGIQNNQDDEYEPPQGWENMQSFKDAMAKQFSGAVTGSNQSVSSILKKNNNKNQQVTDLGIFGSGSGLSKQQEENLKNQKSPDFSDEEEEEENDLKSGAVDPIKFLKNKPKSIMRKSPKVYVQN